MSILGYGLTERRVNFGVIFWTTIVGGFFSSLVKWGSEVNMPPRVPGEVSPPPWRLSRQEQRVLMDFAAYADAHREERLVELSAPLAAKLPDCDGRERVRLLRAWGRFLRGMRAA